jgi:hypothetical protein
MEGNKLIFIPIIYLFCCNNFAFAQSDSIIIRAKLINTCHDALENLTPGDDQELKDSLVGIIKRELPILLNDPNVSNYRIDSILTISNTISPDRKLIIFSQFEFTGGSYRSSYNMMWYQLANGKSKACMMSLCSQDADETNAYGGGIDSIEILKSKSGLKYLLLGAGTSCNTCVFNHAELLEIKEDTIQSDFCMTLDYRYGDGYMKYDAKNKIVSYEFTVDMDDALYGGDCTDGDKISDNKCRYKNTLRFNGETFESISTKK